MYLQIYNKFYSRPLQISENITIGINKIHSLWFFLQAISGGIYTNDVFKTFFKESKQYKNKETKRILYCFKKYNDPDVAATIFKYSAKSKSIYHLESMLSRCICLNDVNYSFYRTAQEF
jgi:hypothetical protein